MPVGFFRPAGTLSTMVFVSYRKVCMHGTTARLPHAAVRHTHPSVLKGHLGTPDVGSSGPHGVGRVIVALVVGVIACPARAPGVAAAGADPARARRRGRVAHPRRPELQLEPELVLVVMLPPLLYATACGPRSSTSSATPADRVAGRRARPRDGHGGRLRSPRRRARDLVAAALALGAVRRTSDAVAATAVARRTGLDRETLTVLEGESLFNDATALVALQVALLRRRRRRRGALGRRAVLRRRPRRARRSAPSAGFVLSWFRRRIHDTLTDTAISLVAPVRRLHPGRGGPRVRRARRRRRRPDPGPPVAGRPGPAGPAGRRRCGPRCSSCSRASVFALIGLQLRGISPRSTPTPASSSLSSAVVLAAVILVRPAWIFGTTYLARFAPWQRRGSRRAAARRGVVGGHAGCRVPGRRAVAAARPRPARPAARADRRGHRRHAVVQGLTLPWVIRRLGIEPPDPRLDTLQRARAQELATEAALARLHELEATERPPPGWSTASAAGRAAARTWRGSGWPTRVDADPRSTGGCARR